MFKYGLLILCISSQKQSPQEEGKIDVVRFSEAYGYLIGSRLELPGFTFDLEAIIRGMRLAANHQSPPMTEEEFSQMSLLIQRQALAHVAQNNLQEADQFMEKNRTQDKVMELQPGKLQIRTDKEGSGPQVAENGTPLLHYTGRFINGEIFDTSRDAEPVALSLSQTIPGFRQGVQGMKEGEVRTVYVHPDLGYGAGGQLPPNSLLIFEVEVVKAEAPKTNPSSEE
jgi:peptidylprolyl isomerase